MKQSTVTGLTGNHGVVVQGRVPEENRSVGVLVPIPNLPVVDLGVLGVDRKQNPAMRINCAQVNKLN